MSDFSEIYFLDTFSKIYSNIKFNENPSSRNRVVPCGRMEGRTDRRTDRKTDMTKLIVAFPQFSESDKEGRVHRIHLPPFQNPTKTLTTWNTIEAGDSLCTSSRETWHPSACEQRKETKGIVTCCGNFQNTC